MSQSDFNKFSLLELVFPKDFNEIHKTKVAYEFAHEKLFEKITIGLCCWAIYLALAYKGMDILNYYVNPFSKNEPNILQLQFFLFFISIFALDFWMVRKMNQVSVQETFRRLIRILVGSLVLPLLFFGLYLAFGLLAVFIPKLNLDFSESTNHTLVIYFCYQAFHYAKINHLFSEVRPIESLIKGQAYQEVQERVEEFRTLKEQKKNEEIKQQQDLLKLDNQKRLNQIKQQREGQKRLAFANSHARDTQKKQGSVPKQTKTKHSSQSRIDPNNEKHAPVLMKLKHFYALLELPVGASLNDVQAAYHKLSRQYHPDRQHNSSTQIAHINNLKMAKINEAYSNISKELKEIERLEGLDLTRVNRKVN